MRQQPRSARHDGSGGDSIYGREGSGAESLGLRMRHDAAGLLSLARTPAVGTHLSQFVVTLNAAPALDGGSKRPTRWSGCVMS